MKKVKLFFTALVVLVMSTSAFAQKLSVKGVISDAATGDALPGVAVQLKGSTTTYALTDASGSYAITVPSNGTLVVTCLGYASQEIAIDGKSVINVGLNAVTFYNPVAVKAVRSEERCPHILTVEEPL
mgnify:CR=1 FL=1